MQNELLESYQTNLTPHEHIEKWKNTGATANTFYYYKISFIKGTYLSDKSDYSFGVCNCIFR